MGAGDMKVQPICQKDVEHENLLKLPEQETAAEPVQENPTAQSATGNSQQEGGTTAVNCQEVDMPSPAVQDTSVPSSSSTRPSRPKRTRRRPPYLLHTLLLELRGDMCTTLTAAWNIEQELN